MFQHIEKDKELEERLTNLLIFIMMHISSTPGEESEQKLQKMFDKCSFIGRKIMINLETNEEKLIVVLKFFVCALQAMEDKNLVKKVTKQILLLVYRTYTNPRLAQSEAKTISVEIIELLQSKCGEE